MYFRFRMSYRIERNDQKMAVIVFYVQISARVNMLDISFAKLSPIFTRSNQYIIFSYSVDM